VGQGFRSSGQQNASIGLQSRLLLQDFYLTKSRDRWCRHSSNPSHE